MTITSRIRTGELPAALGRAALHASRLALIAVLLHGCKDTLVPDLNNPSLEGIITNPTRAQVQTMARGVLDGNRTQLRRAAMGQPLSQHQGCERSHSGRTDGRRAQCGGEGGDDRLRADVQGA